MASNDTTGITQTLTPYLWQQDAWQMFMRAASADRLHHAYLVVGSAGVGKRDFASLVARALLCSESPDKSPCGKCSRCALNAAGTHPDITLLDWIDNARVISVEQIRKLTSQLTLTTTYGPYRVAIINKAHTMTRAAANSLLKTLEEPGSGCVLILLADNDAHLPVTVRSRCQRLVLPLPEKDQALEWLESQKIANPAIALEFAHGAPLLARDRATEVDLDAISRVKSSYLDFLTLEFEPAELARLTDEVLGTRDSITLFLQWTTEHIKSAELSPSNGRTNNNRSGYERRFLSRALQRLQDALRLDNPSLKTRTVLEGVLADIRIMRVRTRAESSMTTNRKAIVSLSITDRGALQAAYMPFIEGGGVFVPTTQQYTLGDEVFLLFGLMDESERFPVPAKV